MQFYILYNDVDKNFYHPMEVYFSQKKTTRIPKQPPFCPGCGQPLGYWIRPPYFVELEVYKKFYADITQMSSGQLFISQRFKDIYEASGLSGLVEINPVVIESYKQCGPAKRAQLPPLPNYYIANAQPLGLATDHTLSGTEFYIGSEPKCEYCRSGGTMRYNKIVLDESTWKGDDIFRLLSIGCKIAVDQRFKEWFDKNEFTGCYLVSAEDDLCDYHPGITPQEYKDGKHAKQRAIFKRPRCE